MKQLLFFLVIIAIFTLLLSKSVFAQKVLDKAQYKFLYEYSYHFDTLNKNDVRNDLIILQVGQNLSKSFSYYTFQSDSLMTTPNGEKVGREALNAVFRETKAMGKRSKSPYSKRMRTRVYKNHSHKQMTVTDGINLEYYKYTDELNSQTWKIADSTKNILDYPCQMAVTDFRGRRWIAWFAQDIPISDGPWKFSGLPGLIMEVYDSEKHFRFTLVGIEEVQDEPIVFSPVVIDYQQFGKYEETTRMDFLKGLARYLGMNAAIMNAELGRETFDESGSNVKHNDLMERDYR